MPDEASAVEETAGEETAERGGSFMKYVVLALAGLLLLGAGLLGGRLLFSDSPPPTEETAEEVAEEPPGPAIYTSLHPPLVVNFKDSLGQPHYMQMTMEVMARDQQAINAVREHTPAIRNSLILLFSNSVYEEIITREGKEQMLVDGLAAIQEVVAGEAGETGATGIEAVFFTSLVIQ